MAFAANATNMVTVMGDDALTGPVTNLTTGTVFQPGAPVSATDQAVALVDAAGIACTVLVTSPQDLNIPSITGTVLLPSSASTTPSVTFALLVTNTGKANLQNVTIASSGLTAAGCTMPQPFNLGVGQSVTETICTEPASQFCPGSLTFNVNVTAQAAANANHCGVYDIKGNPIGVSGSSWGSVSNTASISGNVYLDCDGHAPVAGTDSTLNGVTVSLVANSVGTADHQDRRERPLFLRQLGGRELFRASDAARQLLADLHRAQPAVDHRGRLQQGDAKLRS